jgi:phenylacetate-CoA ligase
VIRRLGWHLVVGRREPRWREVAAEIAGVAGLDAARLAERTARVLGEHLRYVATTIPFHRARVAPDAPLTAFPILDRATLQREGEALRDPTRPVASLHEETSGGSTGEPVRLWNDADYAVWTFATEIHVLRSWGLTPWCRRTYLWGDDRERAQVGWKERIARRIHDDLFLNAFRMDDATIAAFADRLEWYRPELVQGYATALDLVASHLLRAKRPPCRPVAVRSSAEALRPDARARIEAAFGAPVRDFYGSRESSSLAAQCAHGRLHVLAHGRLLELVDDAGRPCPPGVPGRVLVTDWTNRAFGLVRYANGDVASWAPESPPCPCGSVYPRLDRILGRTSDFLTAPSGERIHGEWFTHLFYGIEGVGAFQVRQRARDRVEVATTGPAPEATLAPILSKMRARLGPGVSVTWARVAEIPPTRSGKHRFTISDVPYLGEPSPPGAR